MTKEDIVRYICAGNATFTIESTKINKRYTYKVVLRKNDKCPDRRVVFRMYGPNNEDDFHYIGLFYTDTLEPKFVGRGEDAEVWDQKMFRAFMKIISTDAPWPETCKFYPSGKCACCGRKLTTPESVERGIGPECWERVHTRRGGWNV